MAERQTPSPEISTGNDYPDFAQYRQHYGNWSPSPPPPPGNYGYQTPEVEVKPDFGAPAAPNHMAVGVDEASIRSTGPETELR